MDLGLAFLLLAAVLGGAVGSFLNVVAYRLPVGLSLVRPGSRCPVCETPIKARHNVPVLGWLLLRGRCASCGAPISARYPLVELAAAALSVALFVDAANGLPTAESLASGDLLADLLAPYLLYLVFASGLLAVALIDLDWFIIPDSMSLGGVVLGVATAVAAGPFVGITWQDSVIGALAGGGVLLGLLVGYGLLTGRAGLGGGDWKLLAAIGAYLGWQSLPLVLLAASLQGLLFALAFRRSFAVAELPPEPGEAAEAAVTADVDGAAGHGEGPDGEGADARPFTQLAVPFGPFLALGALEYLLFREPLQAALSAWLSVSG